MLIDRMVDMSEKYVDTSRTFVFMRGHTAQPLACVCTPDGRCYCLAGSSMVIVGYDRGKVEDELRKRGSAYIKWIESGNLTTI